jgi:VanZ family protein
MSKQKKLSDRFYFTAAIIWTMIILIISIVSANQINRLKMIDIVGIDKIGHFIFYTILSFLWSGVKQTKNMNKILIIFLCSSFGFLLEIFQFYVFIGRSFEIYDAFVNIAGVLSGVFLFNKVHYK